MTCSDIDICNYSASKIEEMENALIDSLESNKLITILVDPKVEMKKQKSAGNTDTLVEYE